MSRSSRATAALALAGFSFATLRAGSARAFYMSNIPAGSLIAISAVTALTTAVPIVVVVLILNKRGQHERTRALLDGGLLTQRGDLGLHLGLCVESPAAWDQLDDELAAGGGPAADSLARAAGLDIPVLAARWAAASAATGPITSQEGAARFAVELGRALAPDVAVPREVAADFVWQLLRERASPATAAEGPAHAWTSRWLGVSPSAVAAASEAALAPLRDRTDLEARARIEADPGATLDLLAAHIERAEPTAIAARLVELTEQTAPWLPQDVRSEAALLVAEGG